MKTNKCLTELLAVLLCVGLSGCQLAEEAEAVRKSRRISSLEPL